MYIKTGSDDKSMEIAASLCRILSKKQIAGGIYDIWVDYPAAAAVKPGQFVNVKCDGFTLRRPLSVCEADRENGRLRLVFEIRGEGTAELAQAEEGGSLDILAPLGNGFNLGRTDRRAVFVGGGIGVPPLLDAAKPFGGNADAILGFRSAGAVILKEDFNKFCGSVTLVTEDGSAGEKGLVTAPLTRRLDAAPCGVIFACGPRPMLRAVAGEAAKRDIPCFVSMEARMACGVGACLSCACRVNMSGKEQYLHVCKNGPVFDARRIVW
jgi:dihydroorotate dehydrogenase electron transfer subunit